MREVLIIVLVILIAYALLVMNARKQETKMLTGFWKGSPEFCEKAGLELFVMNISKDVGGNRSGYILAQNEDGIIINNPVDMSFLSATSYNYNVSDVVEYRLVIDWLGEPEYDFFPKEQVVYYYPELSKLVFTSRGEITIVLYKDPICSDLVNQLPEDALEKNDKPNYDIDINEQNNEQIMDQMSETI